MIILEKNSLSVPLGHINSGRSRRNQALRIKLGRKSIYLLPEKLGTL